MSPGKSDTVDPEPSLGHPPSRRSALTAFSGARVFLLTFPPEESL